LRHSECALDLLIQAMDIVPAEHTTELRSRSFAALPSAQSSDASVA
jgi:hypothetical protein